MKRTDVKSSNIRSVGYDQPGLYLEVEFKRGGVYGYKGVPLQTYQSFITAPSLGTYFHDRIKNNYKSNKIK